MATRSPEEAALLAGFARQYRHAQDRAMLAIERAVCGCDYGSTRWTTREEAERVTRLLWLTGQAASKKLSQPPRIETAPHIGCAGYTRTDHQTLTAPQAGVVRGVQLRGAASGRLGFATTRGRVRCLAVTHGLMPLARGGAHDQAAGV